MSEGGGGEGEEEAFSQARFGAVLRILVSVASFLWSTPMVLGALVVEDVRV